LYDLYRKTLIKGAAVNERNSPKKSENLFSEKTLLNVPKKVIKNKIKIRKGMRYNILFF
jgi:hypothetical protein